VTRLATSANSLPTSPSLGGSSPTTAAARPRDWSAHDLLDKDVLSKKSLEEVMDNQSEISRRWGIATAITVDDFVEALRASRGAG
jgi:hypothetical protein